MSTILLLFLTIGCIYGTMALPIAGILLVPLGIVCVLLFLINLGDDIGDGLRAIDTWSKTK